MRGWPIQPLFAVTEIKLQRESDALACTLVQRLLCRFDEIRTLIIPVTKTNEGCRNRRSLTAGLLTRHSTRHLYARQRVRVLRAQRCRLTSRSSARRARADQIEEFPFKKMYKALAGFTGRKKKQSRLMTRKSGREMCWGAAARGGPRVSFLGESKYSERRAKRAQRRGESGGGRSGGGRRR